MSYTQPQILAIVKRGIDAKTTGATTLFTTENAGRRFYPLKAVVEIASATSLTVANTLAIGTNSTSFNNLLAATVMTGLTAVNTMITSNLSLTAVSSVAPNTAIKVNVSVGATATAATMDVTIIGFYQ